MNGSPSAQNSLLIDRQHGLEAARLLRDDLQLDFCSNVTAVDWPDREKTEKVKTKQVVDGVEKEVEETKKTMIPGYLEVVYHLFSMAKKDGPVVITDAHRQPDRRRDAALAYPGLEERGISGARGFRPIWGRV